MTDGSELAGEFGAARSLHFAPRRKIPPAEQVGGRYDRRPHGTVFIGALRPGEIAIQPKIEAQNLWYIAVGQVLDRGQQVLVAEGLAQHPALGESRCQVDVGNGGNIEQSHPAGKIQKKVRLIGDHQVRRDVPVVEQFAGALRFANHNLVTLALQHVPQETTDKWIFRDQNPGAIWGSR
jgi:hypothetical protein